MSERPALIHLFSSNKWGGAQQYAFDICEYYNDQGWHVTAVTRDAKVVDDHFKETGIELLNAPLRGLFDLPSVVKLAKHFKRLPKDNTYVHVHRYRDAFTVLLAKRFARRPDIRVISTRHTVRRGRNTWLFRRIYDKVNAHIFVSETAFEHFRKSWPDKLPMAENKVHILHNSINMSPGLPVKEPDRGPIFALYIGPLVKGKGIETIIGALSMMPRLKLRLKIAGKGDPDYLDKLRRQAINANVMDKIDWKTDTEITDRLISQCHFAVLPSIDPEAFGFSNIRVMAAGRPQICTPSGAQKEYLADGQTAIFTKPEDIKGLAEAMKRLASDAALREEMGSNAYRQYTGRLSWQSFIPKLTEIYKKA